MLFFGPPSVILLSFFQTFDILSTALDSEHCKNAPYIRMFPTSLLGKEGEFTMKVFSSKQFESEILEIPFKIASKLIKYLGINLSNLYTENHKTLLKVKI